LAEWEELVPLILERARALEYRVDEVGKADNRPVWSGAVLESTWLAEKFPARPAPFIEIQAIVRRWVAIDHSGECQVERDGGDMRRELEEHVGISCTAVNRILSLKTSFGPQSAEDLVSDRGVAAPFTEECNELWQEQYGKRFGHYAHHLRAAPKKTEKLKTGTYSENKRGVFRAAAECLAEVNAQTADLTYAQQPADPKLQASTFWNARFGQFHELSEKKVREQRVAVEAIRATGRPLFPQPKMRAAQKDAAAPQNVKSITFLEPRAGDLAGGLERLSGVRAALQADLLIVDDTRRLSRADDPAWVQRLLYIVARGATILQRKVWSNANQRLQVIGARNFVVHVALAAKVSVVFVLAPAFAAAHPALKAALEECAALPKSKWRVADTAAGGAEKQRVECTTWQSLGDWLVSNRCVQNSGRVVWRA
jgi:hypothetical protein